MKRKLLFVLLTIIMVVSCAIGLAACGGNDENSGSSVNGTYYLYENETLDKTQYITLNNGKWTDDDDANGTYTLNGSDIVFYAEVMSSKKELYSGTIKDGVLTLSAFGANTTYCKEGSQPTENPPAPTTQYTVTYDANGGTFTDGTSTISQTVEENSLLTAPTSPSKTGATFSGWATSANGSKLWNFAADTVTENMMLYAVWNEESAAIISVDGASISDRSIFMLVDKETEYVSLANMVVCSSGSTWRLYYDRLGLTEIATKIAAQPSGSLDNGDNTFYIVVTSSDGTQVNTYELTIHRSYAVSVNYYDNKNNLLDSKTVYTGNEFTASYTPNIAGYTFNGWKDGDGASFTSGTLWSSLSLYADCTANTYTATLDVNGGDDMTDTSQTVTYDSEYNLSVPKRTGYTFLGWYTGSTQLTDEKGASLAVWNYSSNKTITAKWQANDYTVTLKTNDANAGTVTGGGDYKYDSSVMITAKINDGYTWLGWYDEGGALVTDDLSYKFTMSFDVTYTAKWIVCPIKLEMNNSSAGTVSGVEKTVAGVQTTITAETNRGYTWLGWYNGNELLTTELTYTFIMPSSNLGETIYTAKWTYYTITTNSNIIEAGKYTIKNEEKTTLGSNVSLSATTYLGYNWLGWYDGDTLLSAELNYTFTMPAENLNYTAKWELDENLANFNFKSTTTTCIISGVKDETVTQIVVPDYVTTIEEGAFKNCIYLEDITVPFIGTNNVKSTTLKYNNVFGIIFGYTTAKDTWNSSTYNVIPGTCPGATNQFMTTYRKVSYTRPGSSNSSFAELHTRYFYYIPKTLKTVTITGGYIYDGQYPANSEAFIGGVFYNCSNINKVNIYGNVTSIGEAAFYYCENLTEISIPNSVTSIGVCAFKYCSSLTNLTLGKGVISIGTSAFVGCSSLTSIIIPESVTSMGVSVFSSCNVLTVYCEAVSKPVGWNNDWNWDACPVVWDCRNKEVADDGNIYAIINGIRYALKDYATVVRQPENLSGSITIPSSVMYKDNTYSVTSIEDNAFEYCRSLTSVTIGGGVISIGNQAFKGCNSLMEVTIINGVTSIGSSAFNGCSSLTSIIIPESVTSIGNNAFSYCSSLTNVTIGSGVTSIEVFAFAKCDSLTGVTFENTIGWWYSTSSTETSGTSISYEDLANPSIAATDLKSTYYNYYWKRG